MAWLKNPFDAPPPIARAPLPSEDPGDAAREALRVPEVDVDAVPPARSHLGLTQRDLSLEFTGSTGEYFRLWAATQALTFLSLGFYAPWARLRRMRYLARHYRIDGIGFEYHMNPAAVLRGKLLVFGLIAVGTLLTFWQPMLLVPLIAIAFVPLPWLLSMSFRFRWQTFSYRNIAFDFAPTPMTILWPIVLMGVATAALFYIASLGSTKPGILILNAAASLMLGLLAWPYLTSKLLHYRFVNATWGSARFALDCSVLDIFKMLFQGGKLFFTGIVIVFTLLNGLTILVKNIDLRSLLQAIAYLLMTVCAVAFGRTRRLNYALNRLSIGGQLTFVSTMEPDQAAWRAARYGLASLLTLGLAIPWATIDFARWRTKNLVVRLEGDWENFAGVPQRERRRGAVSDGLADQFGIEVGW